MRPVTGGYVFLHSFDLLKRLVPFGVIAGLTPQSDCAPDCHCGPDPQSMNPHGRLVLRGVVFEVLHNRFEAVGGQSLLFLTC